MVKQARQLTLREVMIAQQELAFTGYCHIQYYMVCNTIKRGWEVKQCIAQSCGRYRGGGAQPKAVFAPNSMDSYT